MSLSPSPPPLGGGEDRGEVRGRIYRVTRYRIIGRLAKRIGLRLRSSTEGEPAERRRCIGPRAPKTLAWKTGSLPPASASYNRPSLRVGSRRMGRDDGNMTTRAKPD